MYLLKILKTHNKKRIPLLNLLINCITARSVTQIKSIMDQCTFRFSNFLTVGLSNSSANFWFDIISFLTTPDEALELNIFYQKLISHTRFQSQDDHLKSRRYILQVVQVELRHHVKSRYITAILLKGQAQGDNIFTFYKYFLE